MAKQRIPGTRRRAGDAGKRQSKIIDLFKRATDRASKPASSKDGFQQFSQMSQRMRQMTADEIEERDLLAELREAAELAILQSGRAALEQNPHVAERMTPEELQALRKVEERQLETNFEAIRAVEATKANIRRILEGLPPEVAESEEFRAILKLTRPRKLDLDGSNFERRTSMQGRTRAEVRIGQIQAWTARVDEELAAARAAEAAPEDEVAGLSFHQICDKLQRRRRKGDEVEVEDVELVATRGLELMHGLRENISPSWAPEVRPRWISMGDRHVYDLALASAPEDLFKETNAWQGVQDLIRGEAVYSSRAAGQVADAIKRKDPGDS